MNKTTTMPRKVASFILSIALVASFVPTTTLLSSTATTAFASTTTVSTAEQFLTALNNAVDGDVIDLGGSSIVVGVESGDDEPLVNNASVTVQNGELTLRRAGIVQGADLTLKDLKLNFANPVRNGVFANEHKLTIENVTRDSSAKYNIHIVMGRITNATFTCPSKGYTPQLLIKGTNDLGKIVMGVFDDAPNGEGSTGGYYSFNPSVTIDSSCTQVSATVANRVVYACGATEPRGTGDGDALSPATKYCTNPTTLTGVALNTYASRILEVYGDTGANTKLTVNYNGDGNLTDNVSLNKISGLNILSGVFQVKEGTTFADVVGTRALGVSSGATLIAGAIGDASFYNFNGGGTLALGEGSSPTQTLTFTGAISGKTDVVFGNTNGFWKTGVADTAYIKAANSYTTSFTVNNDDCIPSGKTWNRNEDGEWSFTSDATEHEHTWGYVPIDDNDHAYECVDPKCPVADKGQMAIEEHYDDDNNNICDACGYEKTEIHDIFTAKDSSKLEQLKAKVFNALIKKETSIDVSDIGITPDEVTYSAATGTLTGTTALAGIARENPLFSTLCVSWSGFNFQTESGKITSVDVTYLDYTWKIEDLRKFIKAYDECMNRIDADATEFQKAAIIHDWVCEHVSYSLGSDKADFALGAIYNGKAVCGGYSQAYQFLCQQAGLECNYVMGTTTKEKHAWNKVKVSGQWFLVDTTWDRGLTTSSTFSHAYFMCNDDEFKQAGDGGHACDTEVTGDGPSNTEWYFANKFWEGKTGVLSGDLLTQDPQLTQKAACADGHTWGAWSVTKQATCELTGSKARTCSVCGETETATIAATGHTSDSGTVTKSPTCEAAGTKTYKCKTCGATIKTGSIKATGHKWNSGLVTKKPTRTTYGEKTYTCTVCKKTKVEKVAKLEAVTIYRLYNPYSGEHLYTDSLSEYNYLGKIGWKQEDVAWYSPKSSTTPVYRLYNRYSGDHHYTTSWDEYQYLGKIGWTQENVGFWSDDSEGTKVYRLFNPYETVGTHHYTTSKEEYDYLSKIGWKPEKVGWHSLS